MQDKVKQKAHHHPAASALPLNACYLCPKARLFCPSCSDHHRDRSLWSQRCLANWISKHQASGTRLAAVPSSLTHLDPTCTSDLKHTKIHRDMGGNSLSSLHLWAHLLLLLPSPPPSSFPCPSILLELNPISYPPPLGFDRSPL